MGCAVTPVERMIAEFALERYHQAVTLVRAVDQLRVLSRAGRDTYADAERVADARAAFVGLPERRPMRRTIAWHER
jgi:hypothetical protein